MRPHDNPTSQPDIAARHRMMMIMWLAFLLSVGGFFLVAFLVKPAIPETGDSAANSNDMMFWILLALSVSTVGASFLVQRLLLTQSVAKQRIELVPLAFIVAAALCEAAILFGLVFHFMSGDARALLLMLIGALGIVLHMPRRAALLDASYKGQF